jgi:prevent-host-death family protein
MVSGQPRWFGHPLDEETIGGRTRHGIALAKLARHAKMKSIAKGGTPMQVNVLDAKSQLSKLVKAALEGEEVIIARNGEPMVKLVPMSIAT